MLIPDRKIALTKMRETVGEMLREAGSDKLRFQSLWLGATLDQLLLLEDSDSYAALYRQGRDLAEEGLRLCDDAQARRRFAELPVAHRPGARSDEYHAAFASLLQCLVHVVQAVCVHGEGGSSTYLDRVTDWENAVYQRLEPQPEPQRETAAAPGFTIEGLQQYLRARLPRSRNLVVTEMTLLFGGFSKQTLLFSIRDDADGEQSLVIRAEKSAKLVFLEGADIAREFACVSYLYHEGKLPFIAEPLWVETDVSHFGTRFMVSRRAKGSIYGTSLSNVATLPKPVQSSLMTTLARIHQTRIDAGHPLVQASHLTRWTGFRTLQESTPGWTKFWMGELDRAGCPTTPIMERAYAWLLDNVPREELDPVLIHGDYGLANVLIDDDNINAVLDWELSFIGDPGFDFVNFMHDYDRSLFDIYERAGGQHISEYRFTYHLIFKIIKGATILIGLNQLNHDANATLNYYLLPSNMRKLTAPLNALLEKVKTLKNEG